jgi:hypothetical protein
MIGLSPATATKLTSAIHAEAHKYKGIEMVFAVCTSHSSEYQSTFAYRHHDSTMTPERVLTRLLSQIVTYAQEWLGEHVAPVVENPHSLATEALRRTEEEEKVRICRVTAEALTPELINIPLG